MAAGLGLTITVIGHSINCNQSQLLICQRTGCPHGERRQTPTPQQGQP